MIHPDEIPNLSNEVILEDIKKIQPFPCGRKDHEENLNKICVDLECDKDKE